MKFNQPFIIGKCHVIPIEYAIKFDDHNKQSLQPKFIEVLCYLAEHFPRVIPREELIDNVWAGNNYVGEKALTNAIWHLRQNLKGAKDEEEAIETIRKVGYRLLIEPRLVDAKETNTKSIQVFNNTEKLKKNLGIIAFSIVSLWLLFHLVTDERTPSQSFITQITREPGAELFPSPSPDGRYVVYKWLSTDRPANLYIHDTQQPELAAKQLTFGSDVKGLSVWSNDGSYLYYTQKNVEQAYCEVLQLKVSTNQTKKIADCPLNGGYSYIDISPDDQTLAYRGYSEPAERNGIYFISLRDSNAKPYRFSCANNCGYEDRDFAFSPDGESIAVTRRVNRFNENLFLVNLHTKEAEQLTTTEEDIVGLTWHPSGEKLAFGAQRADIRTGYVIDIDDKKITELDIDGFSYPGYAKHSGQLYYQQRDEKYHIASLQINQDISISPFPVIQSDFNHHSPDYSPIAQKLVYVSNESGFYELWLSDANGRNRKQLTNLQQTLRYPSWSHDGTRIAFLAPSENNNSDKIYILDADSLKLSVVPSPYAEHNRPTWSFDDNGIISAIYDHEYTDLHYISIADGTSKRITFDGGRYGVMISPTEMLYTTTKNGLWRKNIDGEAPPLNVISEEKFNSTYTWTYKNRGVYFRHNTLSSHHIVYYDFTAQKEIPIVRLPLRTFESYGSLTYLPKLNKLMFAATQHPQADIKLLTTSATN